MKHLKLKNIFSRNASSEHLLEHPSSSSYMGFDQIDGRHPFQEVPGAFIPYYARTKKGGEVIFFNFDLGKEMGLIPQDHPHELTHALKEKIKHTFGIVIINEYDVIHKTPINKKDIRKYPYMATRYLQLQHPNKKGVTSGDGRSIWNGYVEHHGIGWDVTSCGTGPTCLSPATAIQNRFFKMGDPEVSYGCGLADPLDGLCAALMSEIFHRNQINTERTLAVISYGKNVSINVRAGKNLLRPSHFFNHLKQGNLERLKAVTDYYINRQIKNGDLPHLPENGHKRYHQMLKQIMIDFAEASAKFEREYIFCWMGWDGDNILANGGIIDYGSVRQFGLFHHHYRFDDVDRFSTTLTEQKLKARYMVQTFAQIVDFIITGEKTSIKEFVHHPILKEFDITFHQKMDELLLKKTGFDDEQTAYLLSRHHPLVQKYQRQFSFFERQIADKEVVKVDDGITRNAAFIMRDLLRELPQYLLKHHLEHIPDQKFLEIIRSQFTKKEQLLITPMRHARIKALQECYIELLKRMAHRPWDKNGEEKSIERVLLEVCMRSSLINQCERVTGDSAVFMAKKLLRENKHLTSKAFYGVFKDVVHHQILLPGFKSVNDKKTPLHNKKLLQDLIKIIKDNREGL